MSVQNHIVFLCGPEEPPRCFLKSLSIEGFTFDILEPADTNVLNDIRAKRPSLLLIDLALEKKLLNTLTSRIRETLSEIPVILVSEAPCEKPNLHLLLPPAETIVYYDMPAAHLALVLRSVTRTAFTIQELIRSNRTLNEISITDALTGLHNRGYMIDRLSLEFKRAGRNNEPLSCLMIDLDHFKQVNDTYGHKFGDIVLQATSSRLKLLMREIDIFGRYGGEEFLIILPNTNLEGAGMLAEKLRQGLEESSITHDCFSLLVTASFGVASTELSEVITADHLLQLSDRALYRAKEGGRNRVCVSGQREPIVSSGQQKSQSQRMKETNPARALVSLVSSDPASLPLLAILNETPDIELDIFRSSQSFFQGSKEQETNLVLIDQRGTDFDGLEFCKVLKEHIQELFIPVLILLPEGDDGLDEKAMEAGADEILIGTPNSRELLARIHSMVHMKELHDRWRNTYHNLTMTRTRLVKVERLTALGEMATGIAHDFNNVLSAILGRSQLIRQKVESEEIRHSLEVIEKAANDGAATIRRIQDFSRSSVEQDYVPLDIGQTVRDCIQMTRTRWKDEAEMKGVAYRLLTNFDEPMLVRGSPVELREVVTNLILNALDATSEGGTLSFSASVVEGEVCARFEDTGDGIDEDIIERVFDPFFSTKKGEGTGLGLSVAYGIIARHNGRIECSSKKGEGTTFRIYLPHYTGELSADIALVAKGLGTSFTESGIAEPHISEKKLRLLIVDDEAPIRDIFKEALSLEGHEVFCAESGEKALDLINEQPVDMVFTDLSMPGMSGWELSKRIRAKYPDVPIVMTSGWGSDFNQDQLIKHGINHILPKPVPFEALLSITRRVAQGELLALSDSL